LEHAPIDPVAEARKGKEDTPGRTARLPFTSNGRLWQTVPVAMIIDPILSRFRAALDEVYGERIERVVLFGSRARGDARPDSDYDVAVFLKDLGGFGEEAETIAEIETDILTDAGVVINALPLQAGSYRERTGLMQELRRDGLDL
jgi:predicted nucleotidyltransferase